MLKAKVRIVKYKLVYSKKEVKDDTDYLVVVQDRPLIMYWVQQRESFFDGTYSFRFDECSAVYELEIM